MEDYTFHEGELTPDYRIDFKQAIFNRPEHLLLQASTGWVSFFILNKKRKCAVASISFYVIDDMASSPLRSPFGSIDFSDHIPNHILYTFFVFIEQQLREKNVRKIIIKNPPEKYNTSRVLITSFLTTLNYRVTTADISAIIDITNSPFETRLKPTDKRRLTKTREAGLTFHQLALSRIADIYTFIEERRSSKNYKLSMSLKDLQTTVNRFPENYKLFAVFHHDRLAAASIAIQVTDEILYDFYHDHHPDFNYFSPIVMLIKGMHDHALANNIKLIDLGTSSLNNAPNFSLLSFKLKLGAIPSSKFTFEKTLV